MKEQIIEKSQMVFDNEVTNSLQTSLLYEKLFEIFHDLYNEFRKIIKKYSSLKKNHALLVMSLIH